MKILVLLKQTPDTEATIKITNDGKNIDASDLKYIVNPYDEYAIEEALKIKSKVADTTVTIVSLGNEKVKDRILKALAMGADSGLMLTTERLEQWDSLTAAKILSAAIKHEQADLVLCGKQAIDDDNMHTGMMVAELLGWPHVNVVTKMDLDQDKVLVHREVEGGQTEKYEVTLPAVFGAHKSLNTPRYVSLPGIMKAKRKPFVKMTLADLGLDVDQLNISSNTKILGYSYPPKKPQGKIFQDDSLENMVDQVTNLLREEAKII